jgi:hypothetical protein
MRCLISKDEKLSLSDPELQVLGPHGRNADYRSCVVEWAFEQLTGARCRRLYQVAGSSKKDNRDANRTQADLSASDRGQPGASSICPSRQNCTDARCKMQIKQRQVDGLMLGVTGV